ncbi:putative membrane protein [Halapricum desulfuricans]|uniref:Putative membrane protein n=2 Tax=Halapricum desulfuricans TaxID=2841257 RepID=A0A897NAD4_9EURY|nr:putative membrane protein [Halapricum desulfuricans]
MRWGQMLRAMQRRELFGGAIAFAGAILVLVQFVQGIQQLDGFEGQTGAVVFAVETVPFLFVAGALVYIGYWLTDQSEYEQELPRIAGWGVASAVLFASVSALVVFSQQARPTVDVLGLAPAIAINHVTVGAVVGVLVGLYDARGLAHQRALETERDRIEQFANKAMDVNTYGRELTRSDSIDAVSALCIQALQGLLGLTEAAFVVVGGEDSRIVDSTVVGVSDEGLVELASRSREQEPTTVVIHESIPDSLEERADGAITLRITDLDGASAVLLALTDDLEFNDEDVQLLELLLAHAATALDAVSEDGEFDR